MEFAKRVYQNQMDQQYLKFETRRKLQIRLYAKRLIKANQEAEKKTEK